LKEKLFGENFNNLRMIGIESNHETFSDYGDEGIDEIKEVNNEEAVAIIDEDKIKSVYL
jgi:hypothetical protein